MMDISYNSFSDFKNKFADLLSCLFFRCNLTLQNINELMIESELFTLFEENHFDTFMEKDNVAIITELLPNINILENNGKDIGDIYWSGIQYINLFLNYQIPLRQLFIICPLYDLVKRYAIYHEMNEIELCKDILNGDYQETSILRYYRTKRHLSLRELSILANIPLPTLRYFEKKNEYLFIARSDYLSSLKKILNIPSDCLYNKTSFIAINSSLLKNENFKKYIIYNLNRYYKTDINQLEIIVRGEFSTSDNYIEIGYPTVYHYANKYIIITEPLENDLFKLISNDYIKNELKEFLLF